VRGCDFQEDKPHIRLDEDVRRAVISDNLYPGKARITSTSKGRVQIHDEQGE
jgi:hypothetical protein